jgi:hypothetical protein
MKKEFLFYLSHAIIAFVLILWIILISNHKDSQIHFLQHQIDSISYIQHEIHGKQIEDIYIKNAIIIAKKVTIVPVNDELKQELLIIKIIGGIITFGVLIMFLTEFIRACRSGDVFPKTPCIFFKRKKNT